MKTDTYTKLMLTIIAICLIAIVLGHGNLVTSAYAEPDNGYALVPVNTDGSINVRIVSDKANARDVVIAGWKDRHEDGDNEIKNLIDQQLPVKNQ